MIIFISQPMRDKSSEQIKRERNQAKHLATNIVAHSETPEAVTFSKTYWRNGKNKEPIFMMSKAIKQLSYADAAYFCDGWQDARGCRIEHMICEEYGVKILKD